MKTELMENLILGKQFSDYFYQTLASEIAEVSPEAKIEFLHLWRSDPERVAKQIFTKEDAIAMKESGIEFSLKDVYRALQAIAANIESEI